MTPTVAIKFRNISPTNVSSQPEKGATCALIRATGQDHFLSGPEDISARLSNIVPEQRCLDSQRGL